MVPTEEIIVLTNSSTLPLVIKSDFPEVNSRFLLPFQQLVIRAPYQEGYKLWQRDLYAGDQKVGVYVGLVDEDF